jgi:BsuBI/PstI restriction endonuclease domain/BsuBI/PstI restriction endonuclease HTH domain
MALSKRTGRKSNARRKLENAVEILQALGFGPRQANDTAGYALLALADLRPIDPWSAAESPLRGITPIIEFIRDSYRVEYAPNTRETIRDEAVKHFVEAGLLLRNPDTPDRPTNSGNTVYQVEPTALSLLHLYGTHAWPRQLKQYLESRDEIRSELVRQRNIARIPVKMPAGEAVTLSPGGQNPLIKAIVEEFCPRFAPGATVVYIGDTEDKFLHLDATYLKGLGVVIAQAAKMPDVVVHDKKRKWLLLIEAVVSAGAVDAKRRVELKALFKGCKAGLVFVTAFEDRIAFGRFQQQISWETEVWIAGEPDHIIHYNGERFLGPYPDVMPAKSK